MRKFTPPYRGLLEYDFVGTPILEEEGVDRHVGKNVGSLDSGLSLRNRSMVLDIIKVSDFENESAHAHNMEISEDQWFYQKILQLPLRPDRQNGVRLPSVKVATSFSAETIWYDRPLGYGHVRRWGAEKTEKMEKMEP